MANRSTYLIQRLEQPHRGGGVALNAMSFGGGGSGFGREAMELLSACFSFDYMGAAEFEFGALPKSLQPFAADRKQLVAWTLPLKPEEYADGFQRRWNKYKGKKEPREIFVLCRSADRQFVEGVIRTCAAGSERLKEPSQLTDALDMVPGTDTRTCGWYELDNGFFFFTDRPMWERTCALFGVETKQEAA